MGTINATPPVLIVIAAVLRSLSDLQQLTTTTVAIEVVSLGLPFFAQVGLSASFL